MFIYTLVSVVTAWGADGHEAIGWTLMSGLDSSSINKMKKMFAGQDAGDVSFAFENFERPWHFQPVADCQPVLCPDGACLAAAIPKLYGSLMDGAPLEVNGKVLSEADALKLLLNLIGDLHQPMHLTSEAAASVGGPAVDQRFTLWESGLTGKIQSTTGNFWWSGWSHVNTISEFWQEEKRKFSESGFEEAIKAWTKENAQLACTVMKQNSGDPVVEGIWLRTVRDRILIAGARSAIVVGEILAARPASAFRAPVSEAKAAKASKGDGGVVWKNALVVLAVVLVFVVLAKTLDRGVDGAGGLIEMTVNKLKE
jgi:hypothetical protein